MQAAKANGFVLSKFLLDQTRVPSSGPRKKRVPAELGVDETEENGPEENGTGTRKTITLRSGGQLSIAVSVDLFELSKPDRDFVFGLIDSLKEYDAKTAVKVVVEGV